MRQDDGGGEPTPDLNKREVELDSPGSESES